MKVSSPRKQAVCGAKQALNGRIGIWKGTMTRLTLENKSDPDIQLFGN